MSLVKHNDADIIIVATLHSSGVAKGVTPLRLCSRLALSIYLLVAVISAQLSCSLGLEGIAYSAIDIFYGLYSKKGILSINLSRYYHAKKALGCLLWN